MRTVKLFFFGFCVLVSFLSAFFSAFDFVVASVTFELAKWIISGFMTAFWLVVCATNEANFRKTLRGE